MVDKNVVFLALVLTLLASAQTACTGLLLKYYLHKGNLKLCRTSEKVQATRASRKLAAESTLLDDVSCKSRLSEISWLSGRTTKNNAASTTVVCGLSSILCACEQRFDLLTIYVHPKSTAKCVLTDLGSPHEFRKRVRYLVLKSKDGSCIYRYGTKKPTQASIAVELTAILSDEPEAFRTEASGTQSKAEASARGRSRYAKSAADATRSDEKNRADKREDKTNRLNSWFWVGPVIGAAATIIAAFIAIFRCSCQGANGSDPVEGPNSSSRPFGPRRSLHWITIPGEFFMGIMVRAAPSQADAAGTSTEHELSIVTIV